jgi:hypothetical protein
MCNAPDTDLGHKLEVEVIDTKGGWYEFVLGSDFGWGGAIFVNDVLYQVKDYALWWDGIWMSSHSLKFNIKLSAGHHKIDFYGADDVVNGPMNFKFIKKSIHIAVKNPNGNANANDYANSMVALFEASSQPTGWCSTDNFDGTFNIRHMCTSTQRNGIWKVDIDVFTYKTAHM